jgi:glycosyltransferase involved in cell wall biosynthesis
LSPTFSIIVAFYNQEDLFKETLDSIMTQSEKSFEIVIVNDGSSKESASWLKNLVEDNSRIYLINQVNKGPGSARNKGVEVSKGKYVIFLDADDLMEQDCLSSFKSVIQTSPNNEIMVSDCKYFGAKESYKKQFVPSFPQLLAYNTLIICAAIKRSFLGENLRFEPSMDRIGLEDWELWISMVEKEPQFNYIPKPLFKIRVSESSRTTNTANHKKKEAFTVIYSKHAELIRFHIEGLFQENRALKSSLNTRIGDTVLAPYRLLKKVFGK